MPAPTPNDRASARRAAAARTTRRAIIAFAVVEALLIAWALLSGRLH